MKGTMIGLLVLLAVCLAAAPDGGPAARGDDKKDASSIWMKQKLEFSQNILDGLTRGDFDKVRANALAMNFLDHLERWDRVGMPEYKKQVRYFEAANRELIRQAKDKNAEGATLAYAMLTVSCVRCHQIVRDVKKEQE